MSMVQIQLIVYQIVNMAMCVYIHESTSRRWIKIFAYVFFVVALGSLIADIASITLPYCQL